MLRVFIYRKIPTAYCNTKFKKLVLFTFSNGKEDKKDLFGPP
jgi:hypothetical protein